MAIFHVSSECEELGHFYIYDPSYVNELSIKEMRILRSKPYHPPSASIHRSAPEKIHPNMAGQRSSSSCSCSPKPGDWEKCSVLHS